MTVNGFNSPSKQMEKQNSVSSKSNGHPLLTKTNVFPHLPGVYLFKGAKGSILYVGKARDLRKRVTSYFRNLSYENIKTKTLLTKTVDIEYVVTATEKEALLLEANLIKEHRPTYNVLLRDDKNYPALRIDLRQPYPRLEIVRRFRKDGALYFGPYPSAYSVRETLKLLSTIFPLRQCKSKKLILRQRPCLNYSLGRCLGACAGKITQEDYRKAVDELVLFLRGKTDTLQRHLEQKMQRAAEDLDFEKAAFYRDRLQAITSMLEKQHVISDRFLNQDVLGIHYENHQCGIDVLFVRQGVLLGHKHFDLNPPLKEQETREDLLTTFIQQYYGDNQYIPEEILVPISIEAQDTLEEWLSELKGKRVRIWPVQRGERKYLVDLAQNNAREGFISRQKNQDGEQQLLENVQKLLKLPRVPKRMACVDVSNLQGRHAVGAIVVFTDAQPHRSLYRRYKILEKTEPDDPAMMAEIVQRLLEEEPDLAQSIDLLIVDGGKGQLNRILSLLTNSEVDHKISVIGLAKEKEKDRGEEGRGLYEKIYLPGRKNPLLLSSHPKILHLLQRLRDEAHQTAISFYQKQHRRDMLASELDGIAGVGPKRRQLLLKHFGALEAIQKATRDELLAVPSIPVSVVDAIHDYFRQSELRKPD